MSETRANRDASPQQTIEPGDVESDDSPHVHQRDRGDTHRRGRMWMRVLRGVVRGVIALLILGVGVYAALWFNWTEGTVQAGGGGEAQSARLVETVTVERGTRRVTLSAMGTVMAARKVTLRPRVSGKIVSQNASFVPAGISRPASAWSRSTSRITGIRCSSGKVSWLRPRRL